MYIYLWLQTQRRHQLSHPSLKNKYASNKSLTLANNKCKHIAKCNRSKYQSIPCTHGWEWHEGSLTCSKGRQAVSFCRVYWQKGLSCCSQGLQLWEA